MQQFPFIFSNERPVRLRRHLTFWACWWLFQSIIYSFASRAYQIPYFHRFPVAALESLLYLIPHMFLSYTLMYWAVPRLLLKGKYVLSALGVLFLFLVTASLAALVGVFLVGRVRSFVMGDAYKPPIHINEVNFFLSLLAGLRGAITIGGLAAAIKLMKYWYAKEQRNLQLQKENMEARLQLLKAQVHPHFLFNTLNNIYSYTQPASPVAGKLVMGLSDMLRYMLYECSQPFVPLQKELQLLNDYITLEEVRYNSTLEVNLELPATEAAQELRIAPLLLLPFLENCFKHGTSQVIDQPWISLSVVVEGSLLKMRLMNGKANLPPVRTASGIGIANVRKRLELLYPQRHELRISDTADTFIVNLQLCLDRVHDISIKKEEKRLLHA
jgi:sensor histidine kinase YesM